MHPQLDYAALSFQLKKLFARSSLPPPSHTARREAMAVHTI